MEYQYIDLFEEEVVDLGQIRSVSTLTFYEGTPPVELLQKKVNETIALNPWLNSRLVKKNDKVVIQYRADGSVDSPRLGGKSITVVEAAENPLTQDNCEAHDYYAHLTKYLVKEGNGCVDKDEPLFHVAILKFSETKFAIFVSISHTLVDGHTYYSLYGMFSSTGVPRALISKREPAYRPDVLKVTKPNSDFFKTGGVFCNVLGYVCYHRKPELIHRYVSNEYVAKHKVQVEQSTGVKISTNDIITSNLFVHSNSDVGFMAVNFRNRITCATDDHAGNYEGVTGFLRPDFETPVLVRQTVGAIKTNENSPSGFDANTGFTRAVTKNAPLIPGFWAKKHCRICIYTNWCSFFIPMVFDCCQQTLHIPILENAVATGIAVGVLYMAMPNQPALAMLQPTHTTMSQNMIASGLLKNECVVSSAMDGVVLSQVHLDVAKA